MKWEELQKEIMEFTKDEAGAGKFNEFVKQLGYVSEEDIEGLKNKNYELIGKIKKLKKQLNDYEQLINNEDEEKEQTQEADNRKNEDSKLQKQLERLQLELEKYKQEAEQNKSKLRETLKEKKLQDIFKKYNIAEEHRGLLIKALKNDVELDEDELFYKMGDKEIPIDDYMNSWIEAEGKYYIAKQQNKGAMHNYNTDGSGKATITRTEFDQLPADKKMEVVKKGYNIID